jgi:hypothetical protein
MRLGHEAVLWAVKFMGRVLAHATYGRVLRNFMKPTIEALAWYLTAAVVSSTFSDLAPDICLPCHGAPLLIHPFGVVERKNRTPINMIGTMIQDSRQLLGRILWKYFYTDSGGARNYA